MGLLESESEPVYVLEKRTGNIEKARIDDDGIVREKDGPAAYSDGNYELLMGR